MNNASPLMGGKKRRRGPQSKSFAVAALLLGAIAVAAVLLANEKPVDGGAGAQGSAVAPASKPRVQRPVSRPLPGQGPPGIQLSGPNAVRVHLTPKPGAALLFDLDTGRVLWRLHPLRVRPIASVTKMMTALLAVERLPTDATALISKAALRYTGSEVGVLPRGKRVSVETLLYGLLLPSGNDAAVALAERVSGSDHEFAHLMNQRARELGMRCTHYVSSYGLQDRNRSCAADLAALSRIVMRQPRIAHIVRHRHANIRFPYLKGKHLDLYSTNPLLRLGYRGTLGLKTGYTDPAGHCFVGVVRRSGHTLGVVLLKSLDTGGQAIKLLNAGFRATRGA